MYVAVFCISVSTKVHIPHLSPGREHVYSYNTLFVWSRSNMLLAIYAWGPRVDMQKSNIYIMENVVTGHMNSHMFLLVKHHQAYTV